MTVTALLIESHLEKTAMMLKKTRNIRYRKS